MDNGVNKKTKLSKKVKNKGATIDSNENQSTMGKKRKKTDTVDGLTQSQKSKKKKIDASNNDVDTNMLNDIQGSSQIVRSKTRSKTKIEVTAVEREDNIENINEPLKLTKKSKKKLKDENSPVETNIQINEPVLESIPQTRQKFSKNKKKKKKLHLEDSLHTELQIKNEDTENFNSGLLTQMLGGCSPGSEIKNEDQFDIGENYGTIQNSVSYSLNLQETDGSAEMGKNGRKRKKSKVRDQQLQNDSLLETIESESLDTDCSANVKLKKKSKKKVKLETVPEATECSNGLTNILADYLPITFGQEDDNVNTSTAVDAAADVNIEDITIKKRKKKTKASQLVSNEESVIVFNKNNVIDQNTRTVIEESNKIKSSSSNHNKSVMDVGGDLNMLALNNNDVAMKTEVNIIDIKSEETGDNNENVVHISIRDVAVPVEENDLLKQLEKKMTPPKKKVTTTTTTWPLYDLQKLLSRIEISIPQNDGLHFLKRLEHIEWDSVTFDNYTVGECKEMWSKLQKRVRKYRLLNEVLNDAKDWVRNNYGKSKTPKKKSSKNSKHPDMPRKPLTPYFIYYLEYRDNYQKSHPGVDASAVAKALALQFTSLSPDVKKKYDEISVRNREQYNKDMEEFYRKHPEIPRGGTRQKVERAPKPPKPPKLAKPPKEKPPPKPPKEKVPNKPRPPFYHFYISELEKDNIEDKIKFKEICKDKWKQLPERNKLVWIHFAEAEAARYEEEMAEYAKKHPDFIKMPIKPILTREDIQIKDRAAGKPVKPPGSAYNLFASTLLHSESIKSVPVKERLMFASNQWKYCTEEEKQHYKEKFEEIVKKYQEDYAAYLESLSEEQRKIELAKNVPKKVKPEKPKEETEKKKETKKKPSSPKTAGTKKSPKQLKSETVTATDSGSELKLDEKLEKLKEPEQPPISPMKYFAKLYTGTEPVAQAWKALLKDQKKFYEQELDKKKREYIKELERFLNSLTKEELEIYSSRKKMKQQEENEQSDDESNSEDTDYSSEDEDNADDEDND